MHTVETLPASSRVWIYQAERPFTSEELITLKPALYAFAERWVSHNRQLRSFAEVYHDQFIVLMVDESMAGASGCSIDSSVHFMKQIEGTFGVNLFDRMRFTYKDGDQVKTAGREEFAKLFADGTINDQTLVFDTLVNTKQSFDELFLKPLGESWHKRMV